MKKGRRGRDRMVVEFKAICAITTKVVNSKPRSWRGVLDTTLCDKVCK
jgi:hypothetical protein